MVYMQYIQKHLNINRILLLIFGLWPYQQSKFVPLQFGVLFGILITFILSQLGVFITSKCTMDLTLKILFTVFLLTCCVIKYASFYVNKNVVKSMIDQIQRNYDELNDENEIAIMDDNGNMMERYNIMLTIPCTCIYTIILLSQFWPCILDVIVPANKTRPIHTLQFLYENFLDQERHFYLSLLHANAAIFISGYVVLSTGLILTVYCQHIYGMFRIASYRIHYAIRPNEIQTTNRQKVDLAKKGIINTVDIHRQILQSAEFLVSKFTLCFFFLIGTLVISASLNLLRIFLMLSSEYDIQDLIVQVLFLVMLYLYMFLSNYFCQKITDNNEHVFATVYNIRWYDAALEIQKTILFLLQKGTKPFNVQIGSLFTPSLEGFGKLTSATVSYFTVIYSMRQ